MRDVIREIPDDDKLKCRSLHKFLQVPPAAANRTLEEYLCYDSQLSDLGLGIPRPCGDVHVIAGIDIMQHVKKPDPHHKKPLKDARLSSFSKRALEDDSDNEDEKAEIPRSNHHNKTFNTEMNTTLNSEGLKNQLKESEENPHIEIESENKDVGNDSSVSSYSSYTEDEKTES